MRKDKKENERLQKEINDLNMQYCNLLRQEYDYRCTIKDLREEISAEKKKYAALLERHIAMMEKAAQLNDPSIEMLNIVQEFENLLLAWYQEESYDARLGEGFQKIKKKYLGV